MWVSVGHCFVTQPCLVLSLLPRLPRLPRLLRLLRLLRPLRRLRRLPPLSLLLGRNGAGAVIQILGKRERFWG